LAHTNAPESRNSKRYQDVQDILAAGIHVISTMNVQHMESLYDTVEKLLGVKVRERIPDSVVAEADQVVNIDLSADDLQRRLREGKVYGKDRATSALENFFTQSNLEHLRELTLREVASQLDFRRREKESASTGGADQVMVCLSSRGPNGPQLLRFGSRLAGRLNRNWYAVYVQTPKEEPTVVDARTQRILSDTLTLANQLGATVFTFKGQEVADTILRFAREYRVGNIVIGHPSPTPWWRKILGQQSVAEQLVTSAHGFTVIVANVLPTPPEEAVATSMQAKQAVGISALLTPARVVIWEDAVSKADIFSRMSLALADGDPDHAERIAQKLMEREQTGSTFLNEGVALPHARMAGLTAPLLAMGLPHGGVLDAAVEKPIEVVLMLLTPAEAAAGHLQLLARSARLLQDRELRRRRTRARRQWRRSPRRSAWADTTKRRTNPLYFHRYLPRLPVLETSRTRSTMIARRIKPPRNAGA